MLTKEERDSLLIICSGEMQGSYYEEIRKKIREMKLIIIFISVDGYPLGQF